MVMSHVGIDVSKDRLDVHVLPEGEAFAVARDGKGLAELVERMRALGPERIAVEATGGFETVVAAALAGAALPVIVVNPAQARHFAQAIGQRAKTDPIDACMIARFVEATKPEVRNLPDEATQLLADLVARRRQIIEMIVAERNREKRVTVKRIGKSIARLIAALEKELAEIDGEIDAASVAPASPGDGARRRTCSPLCRASGRSPLARSSPNCPNSGPSTASGSRASQASPRSPASPASGEARP